MKVLRDAQTADPALHASLEARWDRIRRLEHRHLLPIRDHWRDPDGADVVTRWIAHGSLEQALRHGSWSLAATLRLIEQVGDAIAAIHTAGLAHGHVLPSNALLDGAGDALLSVVALAELAARAQGTLAVVRHPPATPMTLPASCFGC